MSRQDGSPTEGGSVTRSVQVVALLLGLSLLCGSAVGVTVDSVPVPSVQQTAVNVDGFTDVVVDAHQLEYSGENVSDVTVTLKNIGGELTVDITVTIETLAGDPTASASASVLLSPTGTTTQTISFGSSHSPDSFARTRVTVW